MENYTIDKINEMIELMKNKKNDVNKGYEIKSVKKNNMKDKTIKAYNFKTLFKNINSSKILSYAIYEMFNDGIINDGSLINKIGYSINEKKELIDSEGKLINKDEVNKSLALYYKDKLMRCNKKDDALLDKEYKDGRYKTMLLKMKLENSKREIYANVIANNTNNNIDMHKGMGKC